METKAVTNHRVEIHKEDVATWFEANVGDIDPATVVLSVGADKTLYIGFPVSSDYLDTFLHTVISGLPPEGYYKWEILPFSSDVVAVVTWAS